ncbi:MAG: GNAT family N-acetyltransferase [Bdellovibrionales bacterium]
MDGPRPLFEAELPDLVQFLSTHLRPDHAWSIDEEYPLAIHSENLNNVRVIKENGAFLSAAVMKPVIIKSPVGIFKAAAIGSVVTDPSRRNQGLSTKVLEASLQAARDHGCDFAILWTNLFDFYRRYGFEVAGTEVSLKLPMNLKVTETPDARHMMSAQVDPQAILRLYNQHTTGVVRTADDIRRFLKIPNTRVYTSWDSQNRLQAYAVEGKGADLNGYIHEWGGGVSKLMPLLKFALHLSKRPLHLIAPSHSANLIRQLELAGAKSTQGVLGMVKILNAPNLLLKVKRFIRNSGFDDIVLEPREGRFYMGYRQEIFSTNAETDLVRLIFGPLKASELKVFDAETAAALERFLPISMWIWGWDSV